MQSRLRLGGWRWFKIACAVSLLLIGACCATDGALAYATRVGGAIELSGRGHAPSLNDRTVPSERSLQNYNSNNNGYDESAASGSSGSNGGNGEYTFADGSTSGGSGGSSSGGGLSNYQFGQRLDSDEFFHWLEIVGVIVGVVLALTAVGFLIYCLLYPFILCCSCVQSEADAFHIIDTYDVAAPHTLSSRPSDSYSMA
jgi:hypothetical protein